MHDNYMGRLRVTCTERRDDRNCPSVGVRPGFVKIRSPKTLNLVLRPQVQLDIARRLSEISVLLE